MKRQASDLPVPLRAVLTLASVLVPRSSRCSWLTQWRSELWHIRVAMGGRGMDRKHTNRRALIVSLGAFRDAADLLMGTFGDAATRAEALWVARYALLVLTAFVVITCVYFKAFANTFESHKQDQGMVLSRTAGVLGVHSVIPSNQLDAWRKHASGLPEFAMFAAPNGRVETGRSVLFVTRNFFPMLSLVPPSGGRGSVRASESHAVAGPAGFRFLGRKYDRYIITPMRAMDFRHATFAGAIGRQRDFVQSGLAQRTLDERLENPPPVWIATIPVDFAHHQTIQISNAVCVLSLCIAIFWLVRERVSGKTRNSVTFRFLTFRLSQILILSGACLLSWRVLTSFVLIQSTGLYDLRWMVIMGATLLGSQGFVLMQWISDGEQRCRVCCRRASQPVSMGVWSNFFLNTPETEYLCPSGHGRLLQRRADLGARDSWIWFRFDESWVDVGSGSYS